MQQSKKVNVRYITFTAVMAALVFVFTFTFKIPLGTGYTHLGDMMIFLAAWLLGGKKAAPAAGFSYRFLWRLGRRGLYRREAAGTNG